MAAWARGRRELLLALLTMFVGSSIVIGLHVHAYTKTSPIDELSHIDTLIKVSHFQLVRGDERVGQAALREEACRGIDRDDRIPACSTKQFDPKEFRDYGVNVIARRFPVYHAITGLPARFLRWLFGMKSIVTAARLLGALWLTAGLFFTWLVMNELGVRSGSRVAVLPLLATTPVVLHAEAIVNSDATLLFAGAAITYLTLRWERRAAPTWSLLLASLTGVLLEPNVLIVVALCGLYLLFEGWGRLGVTLTGLAIMAIGLGAFVLLPTVHDVLIGRTAVTVGPVNQAEADAQHRAPEILWGPVPPSKILGQVTGLVTPVKRPYIPGVLAGTGTDVLVPVTDWLLVGALFAVLALGKRRTREERLALAVLIVMLAGGPLHAAWNAGRDVFFAVPPRFGIPLLPAMFAVLAGILTKRAARWTVGAVSIMSVAFTVARLA